MERQYKTGQHVIYVDQFGKPHDAIVTIWWDNYRKQRHAQTPEGYFTTVDNNGADMPGCNVVFVTSDEMKRDSYGYQIERETSVVHKSNQAAHGRYWCFPEEL